MIDDNLVEISKAYGFESREALESVVRDRPFGCSPKQTKFALYLLSGKAAADAAELAGYGGSRKILSSQACRAKGSRKVRALIEFLRQRQASVETGIVEPDELLRIFSNIARHGRNESDRLRAAELLSKYHSLFDNTQPEQDHGMAALAEVLDKMIVNRERDEHELDAAG